MRARDEAISAGRDPGPRDPRLAQFVRQRVLDGEGGWRFEGLPAGDYMVLCRFLARAGAPVAEDTEVARVISLGAGEARELVLTPW
ncbi:MAG: hypothetical protein LBJ10_12150 [Clostridiales bacterium]|nr:hypothetical protein [Clostridiales bacterium]